MKTAHFDKSQCKKNKGFTLIELLVVIAILAILSTIAVGVFGNAQKNARDGKVKSEVTMIGRSIESARVIDTSGVVTYKYDSTARSADFKTTPTGVTYAYCVKTSDTAALTDNPVVDATWTTAACSSDANWKVFGTASDFTSAKYWRVCGRLETSTTPTCISSTNP